MATSENTLRWIDGIPYEIAYWNSLLKIKKSREGLFAWSKAGEEVSVGQFDLPVFLRRWKMQNSGNPVILDVGCGISYYMGDKLDGEILDVHFIDPLAPFYNKLLSRYNIRKPPIEFGMIEYLSAFYPEQNVAFIQVQNALDHCSNPLKGIFECLNCLAVGGILYLKHFINEAERENYRGFHQFNIDNVAGQLVIWNKNERYDVGELTKDFCRITLVNGENNEIIAVVEKTASLPVDYHSLQKDRKDLCQQTISITELLGSTKFTLRYQFYSALYTVGQVVMRFFSPQFKARIKRILRRN